MDSNSFLMMSMNERNPRKSRSEKINSEYNSLVSRPIDGLVGLSLGLSLGNHLPSYFNYLLSDQPESYDGNHILFLHPNLDNSLDPDSYHNRTGNLAMNINTNTVILIPVFAAEYHIGSYYKGTKIESEIGARRAVREHIGEGREMWALIDQIEVNEKPFTKGSFEIVSDLLKHYVESPLFQLRVSERNPFKDNLPYPIKAGNYDAVAGGYFILINAPKPGRYIIWFGANGPGMNHSEAYMKYGCSLIPNESQ